MQYANRDFRSAKMDSGSRRITNTWLIGEGGSASRGDFLLHSDGSVSESRGTRTLSRLSMVGIA